MHSAPVPKLGKPGRQEAAVPGVRTTGKVVLRKAGWKGLPMLPPAQLHLGLVWKQTPTALAQEREIGPALEPGPLQLGSTSCTLCGLSYQHCGQTDPLNSLAGVGQGAQVHSDLMKKASRNTQPGPLLLRISSEPREAPLSRKGKQVAPAAPTHTMGT